MEGQTGVWLLAALLVAALMSAEAQNMSVYFEVGGKLVLTPKPVSGPITGIVWKLNGGIVGEWADGTQPLVYSSAFNGRASLNTATGVLEIMNMMMTDIGLYTVEINNMVQAGGYDAKAIKQVPKPVVKPVPCDKHTKSCVLSCFGDITGAGPVSFYWKKGDGQWAMGVQNMTLTKETHHFKTFTCRMMNPLGYKDSDPLKNPFHKPLLGVGAILGIAAGVIAAIGFAVGVGVMFCFKKK